MDVNSLLWALAWGTTWMSLQVTVGCGVFLWWLWRPKTVFFSGQTRGQN